MRTTKQRHWSAEGLGMFLVMALLLAQGGVSALQLDCQDPLWSLLDDDVPGNATETFYILRDMIQRGEEPPDLVDRLKFLVGSFRDGINNDQAHCYAAELLVLAEPGLLLQDFKWQPKLFELLMKGLEADDIPYNGSETSWILRRLLDRKDGAVLRDLLEEQVTYHDLQLRQWVTLLLAESYRKAGVPPSEWAPRQIENMVEGLRSDGIRGHRGSFANASHFLRLFHEMDNDPPVDLIASELGGTDAQSQFAAAVLLAHWEKAETFPEVNPVLVPLLVDGKGTGLAFAAYQALYSSGKRNTERVLNEFEPSDWQQAALLECVAAFHGLSVPFATDTLRSEWLGVIEKHKQPSPTSTNDRIALAALFLDPGTPSYLEDKETPASLERMLRAGQTLQDRTARAEWMATWFPMLDPRDKSSAGTAVGMGSLDQIRAARFPMSNFVLARGRVGAVGHRMSAEALYDAYGREATKDVDLQLEGMPAPAVEVYIPGMEGDGPSLVAEMREAEGKKFFYRVRVYDGRFHTGGGIHVGSTLGELRKAYIVDSFASGEGNFVARVPELGMSFLLDVEPPHEWYENQDPALIPDGASTTAVFVQVD